MNTDVLHLPKQAKRVCCTVVGASRRAQNVEPGEAEVEVDQSKESEVEEGEIMEHAGEEVGIMAAAPSNLTEDAPMTKVISNPSHGHKSVALAEDTAYRNTGVDPMDSRM